MWSTGWRFQCASYYVLGGKDTNKKGRHVSLYFLKMKTNTIYSDVYLLYILCFCILMTTHSDITISLYYRRYKQLISSWYNFFFHISKAFNAVSHRIPLDKMSSTHLDKHAVQRVRNWPVSWVRRFIMNGVTADWWPVPEGVLQGSILSSVVFNGCIDSLGTGLLRGL